MLGGDGMSAAPNDPANLGKNRRPPQVNGGTGKDPVWEIELFHLQWHPVAFQELPSLAWYV